MVAQNPDRPESPYTARARIAGLTLRGASPERIDDARRGLAVANIAAAIEREAAKAPPLTAKDAAKLRALLPAPAGGDD